MCYVQRSSRHWDATGVYSLTQEQVRQRAELQHDKLVLGLSKTLDGGEWQVTLLVFVGGMCGSVEEIAFKANMELLVVRCRRKDQ